MQLFANGALFHQLSDYVIDRLFTHNPPVVVVGVVSRCTLSHAGKWECSTFECTAALFWDSSDINVSALLPLRELAGWKRMELLMVSTKMGN